MRVALLVAWGIATSGFAATPVLDFEVRGADRARVHFIVDDKKFYEKRFARDDIQLGEIISCGKLSDYQLRELKRVADVPGVTGEAKRSALLDKFTVMERYDSFDVVMTEKRESDTYRITLHGDGLYEIREGAEGKEKVEVGRVCREPFQALYEWAKQDGVKLLRDPCTDMAKKLPQFTIRLVVREKTYEGTCFRAFDRMPAGWQQFWTKIAATVAKGGRR